MNWGWGTCTAFSWRDASVWLVCLCSNTHKHRQSDLLYYSRTSRWCSPPADTHFQNNTTKQPTACRALGKRTTNWKQRTRQTQQNADRGKGCSDGTSRRRQTDDRPLPGRPTRCPQPGGSQRARGAAGPGEREGPEAGSRPSGCVRG